jgi:transcriptional regulator GlxA family with amidase domain
MPAAPVTRSTWSSSGSRGGAPERSADFRSSVIDASMKSNRRISYWSLRDDIEASLAGVAPAVPWLRRMHERGADLASMCTGAFVLAETGLLDGRAATTHWIAHDLFRARYPLVTLRPERIIVDEGRLITSGGATSFLNLVMYLAEKFLGAATAQAASKMFLIDLNKGAQTAYAIFSTQKTHGDAAVLRAQAMIEEGAGGSLSVAGLASSVAVSPRQFIRRFKAATGNTPVEYIQRVRVEAAKKHLETSSLGWGEIVQRVGYEDLASFRRVFVKYVGISPTEYRKRYQLRGAAEPRVH